MSEDPLALEERRLREAQAHVARQVAIVFEMERDGHTSAAKIARELLATMWDTLQLTQDHVERLRRKRSAGTKSD